jgi:hypothetical protein
MEPDRSMTPNLGSSLVTRRRSLLGLGFWVSMVFGLVCIALGIFIGVYGPQVFRQSATSPSPAAGAIRAVEPSAAGSADAVTVSADEVALDAPKSTVPDAELFAINQRVGRLEADQHLQAAAAASALAASALQQAAQSSQPFDEDLKAVEPLLPATTDLRTLRGLAQTGAPTRSALASSFPEVAAKAAVAARTPGKDSGPFAEALHVLASIVTIRRVDKVSGKGPDAVLARAERLLNDGELDGTLKALDDLPKDAQLSMAQWRSGLERRAALDRQIGALRASALKGLSHSASREVGS